MGMDVYGKQATDKRGEYFRNNVWYWRPLADYVCAIAPELTAKCKHWQTNDGDGLNGADSKRLASILRDELDNGRTADYAMRHHAELEALPDERCTICGGTGYRAEPPTAGPGTMPCNGCEATGKRRPTDTWYHFDLDNVREFAEFLEHCGGFEIN